MTVNQQIEKEFKLQTTLGELSTYVHNKHEMSDPDNGKGKEAFIAFQYKRKDEETGEEELVEDYMSTYEDGRHIQSYAGSLNYNFPQDDDMIVFIDKEQYYIDSFNEVEDLK